MARADYRTLVASKIQDSAQKVTPARIDEAINEAVTIYSRPRPRRKIQTITGTGVAYTFAHPSDWEDDFSRVEQIEYPTGEQAPEYIDANEYDGDRLQSDNTRKLQLFNEVIPNLDTAYVTYTLRHVLTESGTPTDTIPAVDRDAVANLAAALCLRFLAAYYAQTSDSTIGAESIDYADKARQYQGLADDCERFYRAHMGMPKDGALVGAASAVVDLDVDLQNGAGDRFFHPRRYR